MYNDFGGTVGGPIKKDKLFYFGSFEQTDNREAAFLIGTVPTAAIKSGNMQGSGNPIYDPMTGNSDGTGRTPFPDQTVPDDLRRFLVPQPADRQALAISTGKTLPRSATWAARTSPGPAATPDMAGETPIVSPSPEHI